MSRAVRVGRNDSGRTFIAEAMRRRVAGVHVGQGCADRGRIFILQRGEKVLKESHDGFFEDVRANGTWHRERGAQARRTS